MLGTGDSVCTGAGGAGHAQTAMSVSWRDTDDYELACGQDRQGCACGQLSGRMPSASPGA